jgi:hypothetical protein
MEHEREGHGNSVAEAVLVNRLARRIFSEPGHKCDAILRYGHAHIVSAPLFPLIEERLCRLEVWGVESFGELGV